MTHHVLDREPPLILQRPHGHAAAAGFEANKVLLLLDGVRLNNAIYRNGHLQNAITVDNAVMDQIEVIYGPGSLTYGSDALGGVVHFRTKDPESTAFVADCPSCVWISFTSCSSIVF